MLAATDHGLGVSSMEGHLSQTPSAAMARIVAAEAAMEPQHMNAVPAAAMRRAVEKAPPRPRPW